MRASSASTTGQVAIALAIVFFIAFFYTFLERGSGHFGTANDICLALGGILSGSLAWTLYPIHYSHAPRESRFALIFAWIGACIVLIGSGLVIFNFMGWFLARLVITFGYGMIGLWLIGLNYSALHWAAFPRTLAQYGMITGWLMTIGVFVASGILAGMDAAEAAPWFVWVAFFVGALGWNVLYTIWCIGLGYLLLVNR